MPMISQAFDQLNFSLSDIDLLVCDKGPGSFTGIRIGIATVKAFHDSLNIPCIGISSLEALAYLVKDDGIILSIMDLKMIIVILLYMNFKIQNILKLFHRLLIVLKML